MAGRIVVVLTAIDNCRRAGTMAKRAVREHLAACVQCLPVTSTYRWKGRLVTGKEFLLVMKTRDSRSALLVDRVRQWHTYELPEIVVMPVEGGLDSYLAWVSRETGLKA